MRDKNELTPPEGGVKKRRELLPEFADLARWPAEPYTTTPHDQDWARFNASIDSMADCA